MKKSTVHATLVSCYILVVRVISNSRPAEVEVGSKGAVYVHFVNRIFVVCEAVVGADEESGEKIRCNRSSSNEAAV